MATKPSKRIGRPPGADAERTRQRLLDAALDAFAARGYDGASIREITGAAGVGHNLVRHYFGSKDDLWRAALRHAFAPTAERLVGLLESGLDTGAASGAIRASIETLITEVSVRPAAVRLLVGEALVGGPRFDQIFDEFLAPVGEILVRYVASDDEVTDADPRLLGVYVFGAIFAALTADGFLDRLGIVIDDSKQGRRAAAGMAELVLYGLRGPR